MFGLSEYELETYKSLTQDFAITEAAPTLASKAQFMVPAEVRGEKIIPDMPYLNQMKTDFETIVTLTATSMAYDYAHLLAESTLKDSEIIDKIYSKHESYVLMQFIKYGIVFTDESIREIVGIIILELPYLYMAVIEEDELEVDDEVEARLEPYYDYVQENYPQEEE